MRPASAQVALGVRPLHCSSTAKIAQQSKQCVRRPSPAPRNIVDSETGEDYTLQIWDTAGQESRARSALISKTFPALAELLTTPLHAACSKQCTSRFNAASCCSRQAVGRELWPAACRAFVVQSMFRMLPGRHLPFVNRLLRCLRCCPCSSSCSCSSCWASCVQIGGVRPGAWSSLHARVSCPSCRPGRRFEACVQAVCHWMRLKIRLGRKAAEYSGRRLQRVGPGQQVEEWKADVEQGLYCGGSQRQWGAQAGCRREFICLFSFRSVGCWAGSGRRSSLQGCRRSPLWPWASGCKVISRSADCLCSRHLPQQAHLSDSVSSARERSEGAATRSRPAPSPRSHPQQRYIDRAK